MPRKLLKRWLPDPKKVREKPGLQFLGTLLHDPNLFLLNRQSVSLAFMVGLFVCFLPVPGQMPLAATAALLMRCNLPLAVSLVWLTNPVTMPVLFFAAYKAGAWMLGRPPTHFSFELTWDWLSTGFLTIWKPLLLGCLTFGIGSGLAGYLLIQGFWRWHVADRWKQRGERRRKKDLGQN